MPIAAKVVGTVRLGLVDINDLTKELDTEGMQRMPEIHMLLHESLLHNIRPSNSSKFALEKAKLRSTGPVSLSVFFICIYIYISGRDVDKTVEVPDNC